MFSALKKYMFYVKIKNVRDGRHQLPKYATADSAGVDFYAYLDAPLVLNPGERKLIPLGVAMAIPKGYELQLRPRSGLALKHGITLVNTPGTIDSDYRNEIGAIVINHGTEPVVIADGDRIAQGVFNEYIQAKFVAVDELDETERKGGFGSTGV